MIYYLHILSSSRTLKYFYRVFQRRVLARIANKLNNTQKSTKTYWLLLKIFLNNKKIRYGNRCIIDFKEKAQLFNSFFSKQWAMYKTRNTGTENGMQGTRGMGGMLYSGEYNYFRNKAPRQMFDWIPYAPLIGCAVSVGCR